MSSGNYQVPWAEGKIRTLDVTETVEQGQLINITGSLATKGTTDPASGKMAHYIAGASVTDGGRIGVYTNAVVGSASIALGSAGNVVYLAGSGDYTLVEPTAGDSDIKQPVGFVRPDGRAQINLENCQVTTL